MRGNRHGVWPALLVALCVLFFGANAWASVVPPKPSTPVYDGAGVLTPQQKTDLENKLVRFKQQTGPEVAVAILPTIGDESIEDVRYDIFNAWGIGDAKRKDGVLLLIVVDKSKTAKPGERCGCVALEIGEYVESVWTDTQSKHILVDSVRPNAVGGDFYAAANAGVDGIIGGFSTDSDAAQEYKEDSDAGGTAEEEKNDGLPWWVWLGIIVIGVILHMMGVPVLDIVLLILSMGGGGRGGGGSSGGGSSFGGGGSSGGGGASA